MVAQAISHLDMKETLDQGAPCGDEAEGVPANEPHLELDCPSPMDGTLTSRSRWVLYNSAKPTAHNGQWTVWARKAEKKHLVSKSPGAAGPGSSFLGVAPL